MTRQVIQTDRAPIPSGAYSQAIKAGPFIYTAGTLPLDPATKQLAGDTIQEQTACVLDNIKVILESAGAALDDVVKTTVHLSDMSLFSEFNRVYAGYFPDSKPARTTVGSRLGIGVLVEIDVVAYVEGR